MPAWSVHTEISAFNLPIKDNPFDKFDDAATYQIFFLQQKTNYIADKKYKLACSHLDRI